MLDGPPSVADSSLEAHLSLHGVSPGLVSSLVVNGWTMDSFAACTDSAIGFDELWGEMFPNQSDLALVQKASIKQLGKFNNCQLHHKPLFIPSSRKLSELME